MVKHLPITINELHIHNYVCDTIANENDQLLHLNSRAIMYVDIYLTFVCMYTNVTGRYVCTNTRHGPVRGVYDSVEYSIVL